MSKTNEQLTNEVADLQELCKRLVFALRTLSPNNELAKNATAYLQQNNAFNPLRSTSQQPQEDSTLQNAERYVFIVENIGCLGLDVANVWISKGHSKEQVDRHIDKARRNMSISIRDASQEKPWLQLTDDEREAIFESMPGGLNGFLNTWGWLPFAKAVEEKCREKNQADTTPSQSKEDDS